MKFISKWSDKKFLAFCHCGYVHELEPAKPQPESSAVTAAKG
jgi:hypothetical protein